MDSKGWIPKNVDSGAGVWWHCPKCRTQGSQDTSKRRGATSMTGMWMLGKPGGGLSSSVAGENSAVIGSARDRSNNNQTNLELLRLTPVHVWLSSSAYPLSRQQLAIFLLWISLWSSLYLSSTSKLQYLEKRINVFVSEPLQGAGRWKIHLYMLLVQDGEL